MKMFFFLILLTGAVFARREGPFKIVIIADQGAAARAGELKTYLATVPPFSRMNSNDLEITVRTLTPEENSMNCRQDATITRNVSCDQRFLHRIQGREQASVAFALTSNPSEYGGSGGQVPVGTINLPLPLFVHELLHTTGLADEYTYSAGEAPRYCRGRRQNNVAFFRDVPPYASDPAARTTHRRDVPWMGRILAGTPIVSGSSLGTPSDPLLNGEQRIGVYAGGPCPPDRQGKKSWRPYRDSIMRWSEGNDPTIYPVYEQALIDYIQPRLGRRLALRSRTTAEAERIARYEIEINDPDVEIVPADTSSGVISQ